MLTSLNTGVSGLRASQERMSLIADNIANVGTTGYKAARSTFEESFAQTLREGALGDGTSGGTSAIQIGGGTAMASVARVFGQGQATRTNVATDLRINGDGFFIVKDAVGREFATRAGDFHVDTNGYLVTNTGLRVQGLSDAELKTVGDIRIDRTGAPATADAAATVKKFEIDEAGKIRVTLSDGTPFDRGQIQLTPFSNPHALRIEGHGLYSNLTEAGRGAALVPQFAGAGTIESGALELSNVDLATEFANLIVAQRSFQANARIVSSSDELLQELVNLKR